MARTLTKNSDGELVWTEKAFDVDEDDLSHPLTAKVELDAIDGTTQSGADRTPDWLTATIIEDGVQGGQWEERVKTTITDPGQLSEDTDYTFLYRAADGVAQTDLTRTLSVGALGIEAVDGTKLYEIGLDKDNIHEYDLSTAWDIATATKNQSTNTEDGGPQDLFLKPDGKKLYEAGAFQNKIYESNLSTPWDISTATLNQSKDIAIEFPNGMTFKPDGKKIYFASRDDKIYEYDLSKDWDISTAAQNQSIDLNPKSPENLHFKPDGKKMYVIGGDRKISEYDLSNAWDISTATLSHSIDTRGVSPEALYIKPDGKKIYEIDDNELIEDDLSTAWDISTVQNNEVVFSLRDSDAQGFAFGKK